MRVVEVTGEAGVGKSALVGWLCERAHEVGAALSLSVTHQRPLGDTCGLRGLVNRLFKSTEMNLDERQIHFEQQCERLGLSEHAPVFEAIAGGVGSTLGDVDSTIMYSQQERFAGLGTLLRTVSARRPQILFIDDAQWGVEALLLIEFLMTRFAQLPVLIVFTSRADELRRPSSARRAIQRLHNMPRSSTMKLGPLDPESHRQLLTSRLILDPEVLDFLEERTHGHPLFTEELVRHWIETEVLVPGPRGFVAKRDGKQTVPDSIYTIWSARLRSVLRGQPANVLKSWEVAAVLGMRVRRAEWAAVCTRASLPHDGSVLDTLFRAQLIEADDADEFRLTHVLLRDSLQRSASERQRLVAWHSHCADALKNIPDTATLRLAEHLLAACRFREASDAFQRATAQYAAVSDYPMTQHATVQWAKSLRRAGSSLTDPDFMAVRLRWTICRRVTGDWKSAHRHAQRLHRLATECGQHQYIALALGELVHHVGGVDRLMGKIALYDTAIHHLKRCDMPSEIARFSVERAALLVKTGNMVKAFDICAQVLHNQACDIDTLLNANLTLATIAMRENELEEALTYTGAALKLVARHTSRWSMANVRLVHGDVLRQLDRFDDASAMYQRASDILRLVGNVDLWAAEANLGLLNIELARYRDAQRHFERALDALQGSGHQDARDMLACLAIVPTSFLADWAAFDAQLAQLQTIQDWSHTQLDVPLAIVRASNQALRSGECSRGEQCWTLAKRIFRAIGLSERADALYEKRYDH